MKNKIKDFIKSIILLSIILLLVLFVSLKLGSKIVLAATNAETTTAQSIARQILNAKDWTLKVEKEGEKTIRSTFADSLKNLIPSEQVMDDGSIYITRDDLYGIPSLFCSAKDTPLTGYSRTVVRSGGEETDETDQGKKTAYLTVDDLRSATVFRKTNSYSDFIEAPEYKYEPTTSRTYGRYGKPEIKNATPAEAWVLAEMDKNHPGTGSGYTFESTDIEYTGGEDAITDSIEIDGTIIYEIGDVGNEEYIEKRDDKYYYVELHSEVDGGSLKHSYVQFAWWKVKTVGIPANTPIANADAGLAAEAEAFEDYIIQVTGNSDVHNLERNEDGTFKIDYKVSMKPDNAEDINVQFNSETNKYLVGPFSVNYLRACTQQGKRAKVSFSGIKSAILVGVDENGNEVLNSQENSILQLGENYRFVYNDPEAHRAKQEGFGDTDEDYPFPYSDEEFFIEMDYLDSVVALKNFKFDFQYMTANGSFELYSGQYLEIHWDSMADIIQTKVVPTGGSASLDNKNEVAVSNRGGESDKFLNGEYKSFVNFDDVTKDVKAHGNYPVETKITLYYKTNNYIEFYGTISPKNDKVKNLKLGDFKTANPKFGNNCDNYGHEMQYFHFKILQDTSKPFVDSTETINVPISYKEGFLGEEVFAYQKVDVNFKYYNQFLNKDCKVKASLNNSDNNEKLEITGNNIIYYKGAIDQQQGKAIRLKVINPQKTGIESGINYKYIDPDSNETQSHEMFLVNKPGKYVITIYTGTADNPIEEIKIEAEVPTICATVDSSTEKQRKIEGLMAEKDVKSNVTIYNWFIKNAGNQDEDYGIVSDINNPSGNSCPVNVTPNSTATGISYQRAPIRKDKDGSVTARVTDAYNNFVDFKIDYKGNNSGGWSLGGPPPGFKYLYKFCYYLVADEASSGTAQTMINAHGTHEVIDITAENGLGAGVSGCPVELEFLSKPIDLRTSLSGVVWIDQDEQKDQNTGTLGVYDRNEKPADENSVEVVVWKVKYGKEGNTLREISREKAIAWDNDNNVIDFSKNRVFIDKEGRYSIPRINVPAEEGLDGTKYVISYDVEFIYDGQSYEATEYLKSTNKNTVPEKLAEFQKTPEETAGPEKDYTAYARDSYIVENSKERYSFDSKFTEVYGNGQMDIENGATYGLASGVNGDGHVELEYKSDVVSSSTGYEKTQSKLITKNSDGFVLDQYRFGARTSEAGLLLPYERKYHVEKEYYDNLMFQKDAYKPVDEYFHQINLGLLERYATDVSLVKDLYSSKVIVNEQETNYTFNSLAGLTDDVLSQQIDASYREKNYKIDLYNSDYYYRSSTYNTIQDEITKQVVTAVKDKTDLRMFVTYRIAMYNESEVTDVSINEFKDYYDKSFTLVEDEIRANILDNDGNREEKVVAVAPYFRKLSANGDTSDLYRYNKQEDLMATKVDNKVSNPAEKVVGDLSFTTGLNIGTDEYFGSSSSSLRALNDDGTVNHDMMLEPGEAFEVFVTYEIDKQGFDAIQAAGDANRDSSLLGQKNNIAEIANYSTAYTDESVARHKTTSYKSGQISGRVEKDSAPDNISMKALDSVKYFEDDTEYAPVLNVNLRFGENRTLDGIVWEDSRGDGENADGIYDPSTESGIGNVDVTMVEKIRVNPGDLIGSIADDAGNAIDLSLLDYEFEYVWPDGAFGPDVEFTSRTKTSDNDDTRGQYEFKNFVSGNYVVRFEYGNSYDTLKYNGQDYKNTAYQAGMTNAETEYAEDGSIVTGTGDLPGKATLNNEWHDLSSNNNAKALEETRVSDARDYEPRRMKVMAYSRTITNQNAEVLAAYVNDQEQEKLTDEYKAILEANKDELIENTAMVANTAKFNVEVEKQSGIAYKTVETTEGGENDSPVHEYRISNVDFGLVRRPETRLDVKKEISQITLTKNDGQDVILSVKCDEDGNIIKDNSDASGLQKITEINKDALAAGSQGFKYIAMESSFLNGLDVYITYNITVTNNSETDYVGEKLASIKNVQELYDLVSYYETKADASGEHQGLVPFNTGKGIVYGKYVGLNYYTNEVSEGEGKTVDKYGFDYAKDVKVTTTVDQMVDYVDNDISICKDETENIENQSWVDSTDVDRFNKFSSVSYLDNDDEKPDEKFVDKKSRSYIGDSKNNVVLTENENIKLGDVTYVKTKMGDEDKLPETEVAEVGGSKMLVPQVETITLKDVYSGKDALMSSEVSSYNPKLTKELLPGQSATVGVVTSAHASAEAVNNMNYDNLAEIVMYSNTVGRRDMQTIPGNANMIAKQTDAFKAGTNWSGDGLNGEKIAVELQDGEKVTKVTTERDAYAARDTVTFSEPTGLSIQRETIDKVVRIILVSLIVAAVAVIVVTIVMVAKKTKYDDKDLLN